MTAQIIIDCSFLWLNRQAITNYPDQLSLASPLWALGLIAYSGIINQLTVYCGPLSCAICHVRHTFKFCYGGFIYFI